MNITKTTLDGVYVIELDKTTDVRGSFTRLWDKSIFSKNKLQSKYIQMNCSFTKKKGTIRGFHYQKKPFEEVKLVTCISGKIFDVVLDIRKNSKTFSQSFNIILEGENPKMLYIPQGCAHGFQSMTNNTLVHYQVSSEYNPKYESGIRWNDPFFNIHWPMKKPTIISKKDSSWPNFNNNGKK